MGKEAGSALKQLAHRVSVRRGGAYSAVMGLLRCRISFSLIRSAIACLPGTRPRVVSWEDDNTVLILREAAVEI